MAAVIALLAVAFLWPGGNALAIGNPNEKLLFGPLSVAERGEAVRINVYALALGDTTRWDFVVRIFNRAGQMVQEQRLSEVPAGRSAFVDVAIERLPVESGLRTLRAEITGINLRAEIPSVYAATLEIINPISGRTSVLLGGPDTLPAPSAPAPSAATAVRPSRGFRSP